jgi:hypothetical protein
MMISVSSEYSSFPSASLLRMNGLEYEITSDVSNAKRFRVDLGPLLSCNFLCKEIFAEFERLLEVAQEYPEARRRVSISSFRQDTSLDRESSPVAVMCRQFVASSSRVHG